MSANFGDQEISCPCPFFGHESQRTGVSMPVLVVFFILIIIFLFTMENFIKKMHTGHYVFLIILVFIDVECSIFISRLNIIDAN